MTGKPSGERDAFGEWRPVERIETPPVVKWPPDVAGTLKWFFGIPGYLFPWNVTYAAIAVAAWLWLTPDFQRMRELDIDWIAAIFARNAGLVLLVVGAWHLRLYMLRTQGITFKYNSRWQSVDNPHFLFRNQVKENILWTFTSAVPIWTAYEVVTLWGQANGWLPYVSWRDHPFYCFALMLVLPLFIEVHFYCIHRLIHWPPLYRRIHHIHHKNANPGPWSGLSMHPAEHLLFFSTVLIHWIVPSHPLHVIYNLQFQAITPAQDHLGFNQVVVGEENTIATGDYMHYLHHKLFEVNYGATGTVPLDRWFGTFHDGSDEAEAAMERRLYQRES